jgi:hypothetical protein
MVEQPRFYYKVVPLKLEKLPDGNGYQIRKARYYVSDTLKAGFKLHPAFIKNSEEADYIYLSAYEGSTYDVSESAYNITDAQIVDFTVSTGDKLASIAGAKPTSGLSQSGATRAGFRKIAHNRGDDWEQAYAATISCTQLLMLIEYASFNMQSAMAKGVCDISDNGSYNCSSLTGSTSSLGNASGRAASTINTKGSTSTTETVDGKTSMTYRGEENVYSNIWKWIDGMNIKNPSTFTSGYTEHLYVADHGFADDTATGYEDTGIHPCYGGGYISAFGYSEDYDWLFIPTELLGNSTVPIGDYCWNNNPGWRVAALGACWDSDLLAGAFYWALNSASFRYRSLGGRLVYFKKCEYVEHATDDIQQMIAPIQTTLIALKDYAVGEQFIYNGLLYSVTAAIASGGTITINANCKLSDNVTNQILLLTSELNKLNNATRRTRRNITTDLTNLPTAVAEQNLEKYGYTIGDYFIGNSGYTYFLADMNTFRGAQNSYAVINQNHISIVVKTGTNSKWNETNDTSTGYSGSVLHSYLSSAVLYNIKSDMIALFGGSTGLEHLLSHQLLWTTATSAWDWSATAQYISALTEPQVYGTNVWAIDGYQTGEAWKHLELFKKFSYMEILGWIWFWLRSIQSASLACRAGRNGDANLGSASDSGGVVGFIQFK